MLLTVYELARHSNRWKRYGVWVMALEMCIVTVLAKPGWTLLCYWHSNRWKGYGVWVMVLEMCIITVLAKPGWALLFYPILEAVYMNTINAAMQARCFRNRWWRNLLFLRTIYWKTVQELVKYILMVLNNLEHILLIRSANQMGAYLIYYLKFSNIRTPLMHRIGHSCHHCRLLQSCHQTSLLLLEYGCKPGTETLTFSPSSVTVVCCGGLRHSIFYCLYLDDISTVKTVDLCEIRKQTIGEGTACLSHAFLLITWWWHGCCEPMRVPLL